MAYKNQIKCIDCGMSIPDVPEDACREELQCNACYALTQGMIPTTVKPDSGELK